MGNFQVTGQNLQVTVETKITARAVEPPLPPAPAPEPSPLDQGDAVAFQKHTDSPLGIAKKIAGGTLLGGGISAVANSVLRSISADRLTAPSASGTGLGLAMGAGIGLYKLDTGDEQINQVKNIAAGALIGGSAMGLANSIVNSMGAEALMAPSSFGVGLGVALGSGIGLIHLETGNENLNAVKNTIGGALIGGSVFGIAGSAVASMAADRLTASSPIALGIGVAIGAGIGLLNSDH
ncbi:hypothetical protein COW36_15905 [bacterium (Candidatus Blackallbacteria) CG17_big_fil_post_rev_8_21_14_2_50_48_46]|uniref:Uncharacterized protein n=1 Tax=bacterium (Candidatus Blackallbacteria) CG17_big_fil_post_rev_8_21_14_2_50_48_46 TaxID=2014261 RepID=A0A2M7G1Y0_9BACT|nr:MAG: hypothetical protein COW64_09055 [bacterium (Candidatus Blackallbacteria) CG18_big_fil_WC_8_21_14_2_50_49_26]PIW15752.1 MAG: hypothetical protein COW36_15905 [bacterium (Candidatus Blackallbacteria) CG17_big_fil_post_rev_8_21_14_2_50_48_46]PIW48750.1 MAG: hypothetical protein COW20_08350 [bacterium (Candidatus Blackallbacteria) CG13_big_fil_rev_8_21_14_2_50_49_14]